MAPRWCPRQGQPPVIRRLQTYSAAVRKLASLTEAGSVGGASYSASKAIVRKSESGTNETHGHSFVLLSSVQSFIAVQPGISRTESTYEHKLPARATKQSSQMKHHRGAAFSRKASSRCHTRARTVQPNQNLKQLKASAQLRAMPRAGKDVALRPRKPSGRQPGAIGYAMDAAAHQLTS